MSAYQIGRKLSRSGSCHQTQGRRNAQEEGSFEGQEGATGGQEGATKQEAGTTREELLPERSERRIERQVQPWTGESRRRSSKNVLPIAEAGTTHQDLPERKEVRMERYWL